MNKKIFLVILVVLFLIFCYFSYYFCKYFYTAKTNYHQINACLNNEKDYYNKMFELLLPRMLIHKVKIESKTHELLRLDWSEKLASDYAIKKSDALISYGVGYNTTFENTYIENFQKPVYAFDCGISVLPISKDGFNFYSECIATDAFITEYPNQIPSGKIHTYKEMLNSLNLADKKVFIQMDISGAENAAIPQILDNTDNITGMIITFYLHDSQKIIETIPILDKLNEKFILVSRFASPSITCPVEIKSKYYNGNPCNYLFVLSYINKNLIDKNEISWNQKTTKIYKYKPIDNTKYYIIADNNISLIVTFTEKLKELKNNIWKTQYQE